jgi:Tfp pilus assembly protein PilO
MRSDLWLAQHKTGQGLNRVLRVAACVTAIWALVVAHGLWTTRKALADARAESASATHEAVKIAQDLKQKQARSAAIDLADLAQPEGAGGARFIQHLSELAARSRLQLLAVKIGQADQDKPEAVAPPPGTTAAPNAAQAAASSAHSQSPSWKHTSVEFAVVGRYPDVSGFMADLAGSPRMVEITSLQLTRHSVDRKTGGALVQARLQGTLYGLGDG